MATAFPSLTDAVKNLRLELASGEALDVREFVVHEGLSRPFEVDLVAVSPNADVDFEAAIGQAATFTVNRSWTSSGGRYWEGVCARMDQTKVEPDGLSTYTVTIAPALWLLGHRRNYRVFQDKSELEIVLELLGEWGIEPRLELAPGTYTARRYRTQYAETDLSFVSRLLEDIGVTYFFEQAGEGKTRVVLADAPNRRSPRAPLPFISEAEGQKLDHEYVTRVRTTRVVKPGKYTQSDVDFRKPLDYPLVASSTRGLDIESRLERYHHNYGSFLWKSTGGGDTPTADDRGAARTDESRGGEQVKRRLDAQRVEGRGCSFQSTAYDLAPGMVMVIVDHPRREIGAPLLVASTVFRGTATGEWDQRVDTRYTDVDFRPELSTAKPRTSGIESATVTGPSGEEIHTDEFGRIRLKFHWDRAGAADETSSCWVPVSQPWAGAGFGGINLPRVGQEVIVDFLGGDPDRPVVIGRVFTTTTPPPYKLPQYKMVSGLRSESYPRPKAGSGNMRMGGGDGGVSLPATAATSDPSLALAQANDNVATSLDAPAGGGVPVARMGAGGADGALGDVPTRSSMPGTFGASPAPQEYLDEGIRRKQSMGPDGVDGTRSANGVVTDDQAGAEKLYLQGQKDLRIVTKNNLTGTVGANRGFDVLGNDTEDITYYQTTTVGKDRTIKVTGQEKHEITGEIISEGKANRRFTTKMDFGSESTDGSHVFKSKKAMIMQVDSKSTIIMLPDAIVIDAPKVFINPGAQFMAKIMNGSSAADAAAHAAREAKLDEMAAKDAKALDKMYTQERGAKEGNMMAEGRNVNSPLEDAATRAGLTTPQEKADYMWRVSRNFTR